MIPNSEVFPVSRPATSIAKLVHYLERQHEAGFFYRGQTRYYAALVPSAYRRSIDSSTIEQPWVQVSEDRMHEIATDRERVRQDARMDLILLFGRGVGNLLAQQYGISSDTIDVTSNIRLAAFFATRKYPRYDHVSPPQDAPGVIYRFSDWDDPPNQKTLEDALHMIGIELEPPARVGWFRRRMNLRHLALQRRDDVVRRLRKYFEKYGAHEAALATRSLMVSCSAIERLYEGIFDAMNLAVESAPFVHSRTHRQSAGLYYPSVSHLCYVPLSIKLRPASHPQDFLIRPSLCLQRRLLAVMNGNYSRGTQAFFFEHSSHRIDDFAQNELWPDEDTDRVLALVAGILRETRAKYLNDKNVDIFDTDKGIIDPGYSV